MSNKVDAYNLVSFDVERSCLRIRNSKGSIEFYNEREIFLVSNDELKIETCKINKENLILINKSKKELKIKEINSSVLKKIVKFAVNSCIVDYKIVEKRGSNDS